MIPPIANRFVAGETEAEAIERVRDLDRRGIGAMCNLLGEHYGEREPADEDTERYLELLSDLDSLEADANVSVKPSQVGLSVSESAFRENLGRIVEAAAPDGFVWIDMEDHTTVDATLSAFADLASAHPGCVGVCVQANMKRTREDLARLADVPGAVRLVKGAYDPPRGLAHTGRERVDAAYRELLEFAFREFEGTVAVGSHDPAMIDRAIELGDRHGTPFEIQMLMGVREEAQTELAAEHDVRQYVPYGGKWFPYFYRRAMERKENLAFAVRAVAGALSG